MKFFKKEFNLFLLAGLVNTSLTYLVYVSLFSFSTCEISYTISFIFGIIISYFLNTKFVFKKDFKISTFVRFPIIYIVQYMLGIVLLTIFVKVLGTPEILAPLGVILFLIPMTFFLSKFILK
jgi:putative flippase GtrA